MDRRQRRKRGWWEDEDTLVEHIIIDPTHYNGEIPVAPTLVTGPHRPQTPARPAVAVLPPLIRPAPELDEVAFPRSSPEDATPTLIVDELTQKTSSVEGYSAGES